jgi:hypothetical protein
MTFIPLEIVTPWLCRCSLVYVNCVHHVGMRFNMRQGGVKEKAPTVQESRFTQRPIPEFVSHLKNRQVRLY